MNSKTILYWIGGILGTFVLLFLAYKFTNSPPKDYSQINKVNTTDHIKWSEEKKNILIEYTDLQCPACKNFHDILKNYESSSSANLGITNKVTLVFRYFPLYSIHPNALSAAYAAEAASVQSKFWEMTDALFDKQVEWSNLPDPKPYFINLADSLKLDTKKFASDMDSNEIKDRVQTDLNEAESIGLNSTPTFILNGKVLKVNTYDEFTNLLKSL